MASSVSPVQKSRRWVATVCGIEGIKLDSPSYSHDCPIYGGTVRLRGPHAAYDSLDDHNDRPLIRQNDAPEAVDPS